MSDVVGFFMQRLKYYCFKVYFDQREIHIKIEMRYLQTEIFVEICRN